MPIRNRYYPVLRVHLKVVLFSFDMVHNRRNAFHTGQGRIERGTLSYIRCMRKSFATDSRRVSSQSMNTRFSAIIDPKGKSPSMASRNVSHPLSKNEHLLRWVKKMAELTKPAKMHWVEGTQTEFDSLCAEMVRGGTYIKLNQKLWPGCYYARSDANEVARVEDRTFICSYRSEER